MLDTNLESRISNIEARNIKVEADKAWEISWARLICIFVLTYVIATIWLFVIENDKPLFNALVPAFGWVLSTLSLPVIKRMWQEKRDSKK